MRLLAVVVAALLLSACGSNATPSDTTLDCAKPANGRAVWQLVCNDPQLTDLDRRLQTAYQQALARPGADRTALTAAQRSWATERDGCAHNTDMRICVLEAYQTRLVQLAIADPDTASPPVVTYRCPADFGPLTARFYNQFNPPTAVLNWKGKQEILFIQPSGSGARYGRQGSEYWEHQGEVKLDIDGTTFVCRTP